MNIEEFKVGEEFFTYGGGKTPWICTDIGTRVVVAIAKREDWNAGPPYSVAEYVFDEDSQVVCYKNYEECVQ